MTKITFRFGTKFTAQIDESKTEIVPIIFTFSNRIFYQKKSDLFASHFYFLAS